MLSPLGSNGIPSGERTAFPVWGRLSSLPSQRAVPGRLESLPHETASVLDIFNVCALVHKVDMGAMMVLRNAAIRGIRELP